MADQGHLIYRSELIPKEDAAPPQWLYEDEPEEAPEEAPEQLVPEWMFELPIESPHFDSYNEYLKRRHSQNLFEDWHNRPPSPVEPVLTEEYREWRLRTPEEKLEYSLHEQIASGEFPIYGSEEERRYFGPLDLDAMYPRRADYGPDVRQQFDEQKYAPLLSQFGYVFVANITRGDIDFDHQVWKVRRSSRRDIYAMKVVGANYFYNTAAERPPSTRKVLEKMEKESEVLKRMNHPNIISALDVIGIRDSITGFSYVFLAITMELMEGNTEDLAYNDYRDPQNMFKLPKDVATLILVQMSKAIDYLHNQLVDHVIAHQAIRPANILFRKMEDQIPNLLFKLGDFEECVVYDRTEIIPGQPFDYPDTNIVYCHNGSSPEYCAVDDGLASILFLRTMPNDVYCVASSVCYLLAGDSYNETLGRGHFEFMQQEIDSLQHDTPWEDPLDELLRLMTQTDPEERITANDLVNHPHFLQFEAQSYD